MTTKGKTDAELWAALQDLDDDLLRDESPVANADTVLREAGEDPVEVGQRGAAFVAQLLKKNRLSWQERARRRIAELAGKTSSRLRIDLAGDELRAAIDRAGRREAIGPELAAAFRKRSNQEMTDEELRELLADIEDVIGISEVDKDGHDS